MSTGALNLEGGKTKSNRGEKMAKAQWIYESIRNCA
jgi:hypothetical protein